VAGRKKDWLIEIIIYTVAGSLSSTFVGLLLAWLGGLLLRQPPGELGILICIAIGVLALARELGWLSLTVPQLRRQTREVWKILPGPVAAALWGLDLGLIFSTRLTFPGPWLIAAIAILFGNPAFGAALFVSYWLGRALSVWLSSWLMPDAGSTSWFQELIVGQRQLFRHIHVLGLIWFLVLMAWFALHGAT
jgi:hypothetical protein